MNRPLNQQFSTVAPLLDFLPKRPEPTPVDITHNLTSDELYRVAYLPFVMAEVVWDYADTLCNIGATLRRVMPDEQCRALKKLSRATRELRREYERSRAPFIDAKHREVEANHMIEFQERHARIFKLLGLSIDSAVRSIYGTICPEYQPLLKATFIAITTYKALCKYAQWADTLIESKCGRANHSILPDEIRRLGILLPQFAGDCPIDMDTAEMNLWRDTLYNEIRKIELGGLPDDESDDE